ncbi:MAG: hypothetical protein ACT4QE_20040, partial [Anaerolineales bacterium]
MLNWFTTEQRIWVLSFLAIFLSGSTLVLYLYNRGLYIQRKELQEANASSQNIIERLLYIEQSWAQLQKTWIAIDVQIVRLKKRNDLVRAEKFSRALQVLVFRMGDHILPELARETKRLAYLSYDFSNDHFSVECEIGLTDEALSAVKIGLTKDHGLAGQALKTHQVVYVEDIASPEASQKGYVPLGIPEYQRCIACKSVWVDDK